MPNTTNYGVNIPTDQADNDTWGVENNAAHEAWDGLIKLRQDEAAAAAAAAAAAQTTANNAMPKAGGTFTGPVTFTNPWASLSIKAGAATDGGIYGLNSSNVVRWSFGIHNDGAGSNFYLARYNTGGTYVDTPLFVNVSTGLVSVGSAFATTLSATTGTLTTGNITTANITTASITTGGITTATIGTLTVSGNAGIAGYTTMTSGATVNNDLVVTRSNVGSATTGYVFFGNSGSRWIGWGGSNFAVNGPMAITGTLHVTSNTQVDGNLTVSGTTSLAALTYTSDGRLKDDIADLEPGLTYGLRARSFTYRGKPAWGFIAQEVKVVAPHLVETGEDGYLRMEGLQILAAVVKDLQDLREEVDAMQDRPWLTLWRALKVKLLPVLKVA